ncbi:MAG TPA: glycosyl hydrolase [Thermoanaerobaculia bacterium]|nr:glycosyl hydrolase [Thermoanaerobaculia bacterium]
MKRLSVPVVILALALSPAALAAPRKNEKKDEKKKKEPWSAETFSGLALRGIGPAVASGRVGDIAIHPSDESTWYVAAASGGVWKTTNAGTTWTPIFDQQGSYSIGCLAIDPKDPLVVWVGTGENNVQRSVSYGDGVYKSVDGGRTWENVGLEASEHIAKILLDPRDSNVVYAAAQGPLWSAGGDRGLYKSTDGGKSWKAVLQISEHTGVTDVVLDPRDPNVLYAAAHQRRRHVWGIVAGGPESALHKSTDGGATWKKLSNGLPSEDLGRIGLAIAPSDPGMLYAIVEAANGAGGFYRSTDGGSSWEKRSAYVSGSPQYYQEIFVDPADAERVYSMDTWAQISEDGGKTFRRVGERFKHVDNHALWIEPGDTEHLLMGSDGGIYESWDRGATWDFKSNLSLAQFYRVAVDNAAPFYNLYGGTQDNNTLGGPSRTVSSSGIANGDWFVTVGGDGFQSRVDPTDPNIVYSQWQYGGLIRYDRKSGEAIDIKPIEEPGEGPLRFHWDSPLIVSPHSPTRLYFAAHRVFRSDDRGDSWKRVSPDLTRQIDRNTLKFMGRVWGPNAVFKNAGSSYFGNVVALAESPKVEGLLYAGTDDGLVQVSENGGGAWRKVERFPGVPDMTYVARLEASKHDAGTVYAAFDNHKMGDFKPYLLKSADRGRTWTSIAGDLPARGTVYALAEDHVQPGLLFAGTEFGLFFTADGGRKWTQLKGGMPVIAVRDLAIQERENDLVVATFGRGFYILDDYTPLRRTTPALLEQEAVLFPLEDTVWMFHPSQPLGLPEKAFQGDSFFTAPNPPFGAVFTYYLKEGLKTRKETRFADEKELLETRGELAYPSWEALAAEEREEAPAIVLTIADEEGRVVRRLTAPAAAGIHRVAWDLRFPPADPVELGEGSGDHDPFANRPQGPMVAPATYTVAMAKLVDGKLTPLGEPRSFTPKPLGLASLPARDSAAELDFQRKTARLQRAVLGAIEAAGEAQVRIDHIKKALLDTPEADPKLGEEARAIEAGLEDLQAALTGDPVRSRYNEPVPSAIVDRVQTVVSGHWSVSSPATASHRESYRIASQEFGPVLERLRKLIEEDLHGLESKLEAAGAPWTPGRVPRWTAE